MLKTIVRKVIGHFGYEVVRHRAADQRFPPDFDPLSIDTIRSVKSYTMTSAERVFALTRAVEYVVNAGIPGSIVECGVWRGGSMMAVARTLQHLGECDRDLYLFDTFEGMPQPSDADVTFAGDRASLRFASTATGEDSSEWCRASVEEVERNLFSTGYASERLHFIKGKVEDTIPDAAPNSISLLRLDTDWYASTRHELIHLYPRIAPGGVLVVDDYGHWQGARKAVDEYFQENRLPILLNRVDYAGRIAIKR